MKWNDRYGDLVCATCYESLTCVSYENDFICTTHGFVDAVRVRDGAVIAGNGKAAPPLILRYDEAFLATRKHVGSVE